MNRIILYSFYILLALASCTRTVYVPVLRPAMVDPPPHIESIAIVDRTTPEDTSRHIVESVITGSLPGLNREAAQSSVEGVVRTLENSPRYSIVRTTKRLTTPETGGNWPSPLCREKIVSLSEKYGTDAILALEAFDSDLIVTGGQRKVKPAGEGGTLLRREYHTGGIARVKLGYRLYDVKSNAIADEYMFTHDNKWESSGNIVQMVVGQAVDHRRMVNDISNQAGIIYAERITPRWVRLNREFFTKGRFNKDFKTGVRRATVNDWYGATEAWHRSANSGYRKTAGRSAFNLALMYEIDGDLHTAKEWAQKAYTDYGIRKARQYVLKLEKRIREQGITEYQLR